MTTLLSDDIPVPSTCTASDCAQPWRGHGSNRGHAGGLLRLALASALLFAAAAAPAQGLCKPEPFGDRSLYLRGSFNSWNTVDAQRFIWACNAYQLVTRLNGEHRFKIGDEGWSADADFGSDPAAPQRVALRGREFEQRFAGTHRFTLAMNDPKQPTLAIETCPADAAPLGSTTLFLRGTMNNWAALEDYAFQFSCDAYYLNVNLSARHDFKIADAAWKHATSFGAGSGPTLEAGAGNIDASFSGEHTLRLVCPAESRNCPSGRRRLPIPPSRR